MFVLGHTPSFFVLLCFASFFFGFSDTRLHPSPVLTRTILQYSPRFDPFPVLVRTLLRYLPGPFSSTHLDSTPFPVLARTLLQYSPRYDLFSGTYSNTILFILDSPVLARIRSPVCLLLSSTRPDTISSLVLAWIRSFLSWILRYLPRFDSPSVSYSLELAWI